MTADDTTSTINSLDALLASKGLDAGDLISAIEAITKIKQRDAAKQEKEELKQKENGFDQAIDVLHLSVDGMLIAGMTRVTRIPQTSSDILEALGLPLSFVVLALLRLGA